MTNFDDHLRGNLAKEGLDSSSSLSRRQKHRSLLSPPPPPPPTTSHHTSKANQVSSPPNLMNHSLSSKSSSPNLSHSIKLKNQFTESILK
ncbi:hypothetical protein DFH28DRAFT_1136348 [Melampsora americana]|nr:hypothetical protein DFH28DRAFT_1136348 [Melampsora americana]